MKEKNGERFKAEQFGNHSPMFELGPGRPGPNHHLVMKLLR